MSAKVAGMAVRETLAQAAESQRAGRPAAAERLYRQILQRHPNDADALHGLGVLAYEGGKLEPALVYLRRAIAGRPENAHYQTHLGVVSRALGRLEEAVAHHGRALALDPTSSSAHNNLGNALRDQGELEEAEAHFREAIRLHASYAEAHSNLANALRDQGKIDEAERYFREAVRLKPSYAEAYFDLGNLYRDRDQYEQAVACFRRAVGIKPSFAGAYVNLAGALQRLARLEEAAPLFRRALELDPNMAEAHMGVGSELEQEGKIGAAVTHYRKALALNPDLSSPYLKLASVSNVDLNDEEIRRIEHMLETRPLKDEERSDLSLALAKVYEARKEFEKAFSHARAANEIVRKKIDFSAEANADFVNRSIATFTTEFFEQRQSFGSSSGLPIFIVGLPRSGTTLFEQIIASHPKALGAGELTEWPDLVKALPALLNTASPYPECSALINRETSARLAERYLASIRSLSHEAERITDKLPFNFRSLGLIALLFPKARVIHCRRDPRDVAMSCYFLKFLKPISFAYDLMDFGHYYREYERLMAHWRHVLPLRMLEIEYEELVADQEAKSREIMSFCGLEWDDRCLAFHKADRVVRTASSWQVRQPIFSSSIGRWRNYEEFLDPLFAALGEGATEVSGSDKGRREESPIAAP